MSVVVCVERGKFKLITHKFNLPKMSSSVLILCAVISGCSQMPEKSVIEAPARVSSILYPKDSSGLGRMWMTVRCASECGIVYYHCPDYVELPSERKCKIILNRAWLPIHRNRESSLANDFDDFIAEMYNGKIHKLDQEFDNEHLFDACERDESCKSAQDFVRRGHYQQRSELHEKIAQAERDIPDLESALEHLGELVAESKAELAELMTQRGKYDEIAAVNRELGSLVARQERTNSLLNFTRRELSKFRQSVDSLESKLEGVKQELVRQKNVLKETVLANEYSSTKKQVSIYQARLSARSRFVERVRDDEVHELKELTALEQQIAQDLYSTYIK